jgi:8-oxo-dGTP pyrophosphatase MutT (NUDIX family)
MRLEPSQINDRLNDFRGRFISNPRLKASAVMMILFNSPRPKGGGIQTHILLIEKARDGSRHSGQIAFPGGKIEPGDASPFEAARRETEEEIGMTGDQLQLLGSMGFFRTLTSGYDAAVYLAWATPPFHFAPRQQEVAAVLEIPLADLYAQFDPRMRLHRRTDLLSLHFHWRVPEARRQICIWGLTARVIHCFFHMLAIAFPTPDWPMTLPLS